MLRRVAALYNSSKVLLFHSFAFTLPKRFAECSLFSLWHALGHVFRRGAHGDFHLLVLALP